MSDMPDPVEKVREAIESARDHVYETALPGAIKRALDVGLWWMRRDPTAYGIDATQLPDEILSLPSADTQRLGVVSEKDTQLQQLQADNDRLAAMMRQQDTHLHEQDDEIEDLKHELRSKREDYDRVKDALAPLFPDEPKDVRAGWLAQQAGQEIDRLRAELERVKVLHAREESEAANLRGELAQAQERTAHLEASIGHTKTLLGDARTKLAEAHRTPQQPPGERANQAYEAAAALYTPRVAGAIRWALGDGTMLDRAQAELIEEVLAEARQPRDCGHTEHVSQRQIDACLAAVPVSHHPARHAGHAGPLDTCKLCNPMSHHNTTETPQPGDRVISEGSGEMLTVIPPFPEMAKAGFVLVESDVGQQWYMARDDVRTVVRAEVSGDTEKTETN